MLGFTRKNSIFAKQIEQLVEVIVSIIKRGDSISCFSKRSFIITQISKGKFYVRHLRTKRKIVS